MKHDDHQPHHKTYYTALVIALATLSAIATVVIVRDEDIRVSPNLPRPSSERTFVHHLTMALRQQMTTNLSAKFCDKPQEFFNDLVIHDDSRLRSLTPLAKKTYTTPLEKEAIKRCQRLPQEGLTRRICYSITSETSDGSRTFLNASRSLVELQWQVRDFRQKKPVACELIFTDYPKTLGIMAYFTIYWVQPTPSNGSKAPRLEKITHGFQADLPYSQLESAQHQPPAGKPL